MKLIIDIPSEVYEKYISIELAKENGKGEPLMLIPQRQFQQLSQNQPVELVNLQEARKVPEPDMFSIDEMYYILVKHGQKDPRFKFGDTIKYSPSEIKCILLKETEKEGEDNA